MDSRYCHRVYTCLDEPRLSYGRPYGFSSSPIMRWMSAAVRRYIPLLRIMPAASLPPAFPYTRCVRLYGPLRGRPSWRYFPPLLSWPNTASRAVPRVGRKCPPPPLAPYSCVTGSLLGAARGRVRRAGASRDERGQRGRSGGMDKAYLTHRRGEAL